MPQSDREVLRRLAAMARAEVDSPGPVARRALAVAVKAAEAHLTFVAQWDRKDMRPVPDLD